MSYFGFNFFVGILIFKHESYVYKMLIQTLKEAPVSLFIFIFALKKLMKKLKAFPLKHFPSSLSFVYYPFHSKKKFL